VAELADCDEWKGGIEVGAHFALELITLCCRRRRERAYVWLSFVGCWRQVSIGDAEVAR
jgi:hypothetical protein